MKAHLSQMVDGELEQEQISEILARVDEDRELRNSWRLYHLIGDALRNEPVTGPDVAGKVRLHLEKGEWPVTRKKWQAAVAILLLILLMAAVGYFFFLVYHLQSTPLAHTATVYEPIQEYLLAHDDASASSALVDTARAAATQDFISANARKQKSRR